MCNDRDCANDIRYCKYALEYIMNLDNIMIFVHITYFTKSQLTIIITYILWYVTLCNMK